MTHYPYPSNSSRKTVVLTYKEIYIQIIVKLRSQIKVQIWALTQFHDNPTMKSQKFLSHNLVIFKVKPVMQCLVDNNVFSP